MATSLSILHSFYTKNNSIPSFRLNSRTHFSVFCISSEPICNFSDPKDEKDHKDKENKQLVSRIFVGIETIGRRMKENLSPKQKGDWKDIMLMCLSFAVYVYISEKLVCAYCVWKSMLN